MAHLGDMAPESAAGWSYLADIDDAVLRLLAPLAAAYVERAGPASDRRPAVDQPAPASDSGEFLPCLLHTVVATDPEGAQDQCGGPPGAVFAPRAVDQGRLSGVGEEVVQQHRPLIRELGGDAGGTAHQEALGKRSEVAGPYGGGEGLDIDRSIDHRKVDPPGAEVRVRGRGDLKIGSQVEHIPDVQGRDDCQVASSELGQAAGSKEAPPTDLATVTRPISAEVPKVGCALEAHDAIRW